MSLPPQAFITNFHNRVKNKDEPVTLYGQIQSTKSSRRTKVVNYSEDNNQDFDYDQDEEEEMMFDAENAETGENGAANAAAVPTTKPFAPFPTFEEHADPTNFLKFSKIKETYANGKLTRPYSEMLDLELKFDVDENEILEANKKFKLKSESLPYKENFDTPALLPIKLIFEEPNLDCKIDDYVIWNLNDQGLTPEDFASIYLMDLQIDRSSTLYNRIVSTIYDAIEKQSSYVRAVLPEIHLVIKFSCNLGNTYYEDTFQWNIGESSNTEYQKGVPPSDISPETFAEIVVADLGLNREFLGKIAFSLHETLLRLKKKVIEGDSDEIQLFNNGAPVGLPAGVRLDIEDLGSSWAPKVEVLSEFEIERRKEERQRTNRRMHRRKYVD